MTTRRTRASSPLGSGSAEGHGLIAEEDVSFGANADATLDDPTVLLGKATAGSGNQTGQPAPVTADGEPDAGPAYPAALRRERDWLKSMNDVLEKAADDFDAVADKMLASLFAFRYWPCARSDAGAATVQRVTSTTASSHALLDVYSRILTQAEHTHQLLRDPSWKGATHVRCRNDIVSAVADSITGFGLGPRPCPRKSGPGTRRGSGPARARSLGASSPDGGRQGGRPPAKRRARGTRTRRARHWHQGSRDRWNPGRGARQRFRPGQGQQQDRQGARLSREARVKCIVCMS